MQHVARMMMCLTVLALLSSCASVPEGSISLPSLLLDAPAAWAKGDYTKAAQLFDAISGHQDATTEIQNESRFFAGVAYHQIGNEEEAMRRFKVLTWDIAKPWSNYVKGLAFSSKRYDPWLKATPFREISNN